MAGLNGHKPQRTWIHIEPIDRTYPWGPLECGDIDEAFDIALSLSMESDYPGADAIVRGCYPHYEVVLVPQGEESVRFLWRFHNGAMV